MKYRLYRKVNEVAFFVPGKFRSKGLELSLELSHELSWKVRVDKERNSLISLALLLHNTVNGVYWMESQIFMSFLLIDCLAC